ncbi:DUF982 domain-containing protein [Pseudodonghicola sp.]|uniref:DUF982 domain-containing protein n=1 Tax=Pseudodonghicola sp. TaxID=1969463 RepID=UPI003A977650
MSKVAATVVNPRATSLWRKPRQSEHQGGGGLLAAPAFSFELLPAASAGKVQSIYGIEENMMEINWGSPLTFIVSQEGDTQKFTTIEQALYWLRKKWPIADRNRELAIEHVDAAMHCLTTVGAARSAFISAAKTAGFKPATLMAAETAALC